MVDVSGIDIVLAVLILIVAILIMIAYALFKRLIKAMKLLALGILITTAIAIIIVTALAAYIFLL